MNEKQLVKILGITDQQIRKLRDSGLFVNIENGRGYNLENCVQEYIDFKTKAEPKISILLSLPKIIFKKILKGDDRMDSFIRWIEVE